jgi:hypothetical protein
MSIKTPRGYVDYSSFVAPLTGPGEIDPAKCQRQSHQTSERERSKQDPEHRSRTLSLAGFGSGQPAPQLSLLQFEQERNVPVRASRSKIRAVAALENVEQVEKDDD